MSAAYHHLRARSMFMFHFADLYERAVREFPTGQEGVFVEIGCWFGDSSSFLANAIKASGKPIKLFCIDTWHGTEGGDKWMQDIVSECHGDMLPYWQERMKEDGVADYAIPLKGLSLDMVDLFADGSVDFLMIDGDHRYEAVKADIQAWMPKTKPGGWMSGDDYNHVSHPGVPRAVDEVIGKQAIEVCGYWWLHRKPRR